MPDNDAVIVKTGMLTPVGMDAQQTAASVRAGICRFSETSIYDKRFEPFTMALVPDDVIFPLNKEVESITGLTSRQRRMIGLSAPALQEALKDFDDTESMPLFLGVPAPLPERPDPAGDHFIHHLRTNAHTSVNIDESRLYPNGRAAGLLALEEAVEYLAAHSDRCVIVGGVDTFLDLYLLGTLDSGNRILGSAVMDGFIPGEGAGFLVITTRKEAAKRGLAPVASCSTVVVGYEEGHLYSEQPYQGDGLAGVFTGLFTHVNPDKPIAEVYTAMNGENHWAKEWGVAYLRNSTSFAPEHGIHHPAEFFGDTGAAAGILLGGLAAIGINKGYRGSPCLVTGSSDFGDRAAVIISTITA